MQLALENYNVETETKSGRVISDMLLDRFKLQVYVYVKESNVHLMWVLQLAFPT